MSMQQSWLSAAWSHAFGKVAEMSERLGSGFPHACHGGRYECTGPHAWTSGFWPGMLWLAHRESGDEQLRQLAEACELAQDTALDEFVRLHHDVGFMWCLSAVADYKLTGSELSKGRALKAANLLAGRFNVRGKFIRAWNSGVWQGVDDNAGWAIIDCTMNISLLLWAWRETGDPRFKHIAMDHADTVLREFVRPDGSVHHIVTFDAETGQRTGALGGQGYSADSAWARGSAWAVYGLAICHAYTGESRYLHGSQQCAHFFLANLPADSVPYWDFRLPDREGAPRDSSAAAIAASGLLLLHELLPGERGAMYRDGAVRMLMSLDADYTSREMSEDAILLHATGSLPTGKNIDVPLIYGDYFYMEALSRLMGHREMFW